MLVGCGDGVALCKIEFKTRKLVASHWVCCGSPVDGILARDRRVWVWCDIGVLEYAWNAGEFTFKACFGTSGIAAAAVLRDGLVCLSRDSVTLFRNGVRVLEWTVVGFTSVHTGRILPFELIHSHSLDLDDVDILYIYNDTRVVGIVQIDDICFKKLKSLYELMAEGSGESGVVDGDVLTRFCSLDRHSQLVMAEQWQDRFDLVQEFNGPDGVVDMLVDLIEFVNSLIVCKSFNVY